MAQVKSGIPTGKAWTATMTGASVAGKQMAVQVKSGAISMETLKTAANSSKVAMVGLKVATMALNMALTMGLAVAIQAAISGMSKLIHAKRDASEAADELTQSSMNEVKEHQEEVKTLDELIAKYEKLANSDTQDVDTRNQIKDVQSQITDLVGTQAENLDLVNGKLDEELQKLYEIEKENAKKAVESSTSAYHNAKDSADKAIGEDSYAWIDGYAYVGKREKDIEKILQDNGYSGNVQSGGVFGNRIFVMDSFDNEMNELTTAAEKLEYVQGMIDTIRSNTDDYASSDLYNGLVDQAKAYQEYVDTMNEAAGTLADAVITSATYDEELSSMNVDSMESFMAYREKLIASVKDSPDLAEAISAGDITDSDIEKRVTTYLSSLSKFSQYYNEWYKGFESDTAKGLQKIKENFGKSDSMIKMNPHMYDVQMQSFEDWINSLSDADKELVYKISCDTDTAQYTLDEWKSALENYEVVIPEEKKMSFSDLISDENFSGIIDGHIEKVNMLSEAFKNFSKGDWTNEDFIELSKAFPELADNADNLDVAIAELLGTMNTDIAGQFASQFGYMKTDEDVAALKNFQDAVLELGNVVGNTEFAIDIDAEVEGMEKLWSAMKESVSSTGLTSESVSNLKSRYQDLENYDPARLFEKTENGIHLNTKALRELESQYEKQKKQGLDNTLKDLVDQYNSLTEEINGASDASKTAELYAKRSDILSQIEETSELAAQYEGLTSAFYKWEQAQSIGEEGDMYDSLAGGLENIKQLYEDGLVGTNQFRTAVQLMSNEDLSTASVDELMAAYEKGYSKMTKYFTDSSDGCLNFLHDVENLNSEWAHMNEDGSWDIDFGVGGDQAIADKLGINVESVQAIMRKLSDYGFDINLDSMYSSLDYLQSEAEKANDKLKELGKTDYTFNFNTTDLDFINEQIKEAGDTLDQFRDKDGKVNLELEGAEEAQGILATLIYQKQSLDKASILSVDTSNANSEIETVIGKLQEFKSSYNTLEVQTEIGADTSQAQADVDSALASLSSEHAEILASLGIDTTSADAAIASINALTPEVMVTCGLDASLIEGYQAAEHNAEGTVTWDNNIAKVTQWINQSHTASGTVNWGNNTFNVKKTFSATGYVNWVNSKGGAAGTAHEAGTAFFRGTAKANGDWGTKESGVALGGELGQELVVRNGKFFTIGDNAAEFFQYKKGDIIFNADQTREIFDKGKITSGSPRGRLFAEGTAFSRGSGTITGNGSVKRYPSGSGSSKGGSSGGGGGSSSKEDRPQVIDWIEVAIARIERAIDNLARTATSAYKTLAERLSASTSEIRKITEEIGLQAEARNRYLAEANSVGLSSDLKKKVQNGTIDISEYSGETADLINEYQEWYEKALDCADAIDELHESLASLYKDRFDDTATDFENQLALLEHLTNTYNNGIADLEARGYMGSAKYYEALKNVENQNIAVLNKELDGLTKAMSEAVNSGEIKEGSEAWYEMQQEINATKEEIQEANTALVEYDKSIRELNWGYFDYLQDRISAVADETQFLVDLMSNSKLYDDKGQLSDTGMATMGLHGVNYNTYMAQADKYAQELLKINEVLAKDPYDTELIERKEELLSLQQDSILAAEDEKQAIVDMVEEGINLELDALKDLIDAYTDSLDSAKDLYDYQKKVKDQASEIASLQKQLSAYAGDTSEENRALKQKLEVDLSDAMEELQETEYEHYISDQKKLLDELYTEYETILNQRLDNVDALIGDMIDAVNSNSAGIADTIKEETDKVGYTMSDSLQQIWSNEGGANSIITKYGENFCTQLTSVNTVLNAISANVASMITASDKAAQDISNKEKPIVSADKNIKPPSSMSSTSKPTTLPAKTVTIGSKINAGSARIYGNSYGGGGGTQYFRNDPIYTVIGENNGYWKVRHHKLSSGVTGWFKKGDVKAYKTGGLVNYTGLAQLDGTPGKPELVLNAQDTENFIQLKDTLRTLMNSDVSLAGLSSISNTVYGGEIPRILPNVKGLNDITEVLSCISSSLANSQSVSIGDVTYKISIPIEHVSDYNDFMNQMCKDGKFEKFIQSVTVDRMVGGSRLSKNKFKW